MKFKITFKDPDGVYDSIDEAANLSARDVSGISDDERDELVESRRGEIEDQIKPWIQYGEYITVEIDTKANTAVVCPAE